MLLNIILHIFIKQQIYISQIKTKNLIIQIDTKNLIIPINNNSFKGKYAVTNILGMYMKQTTIF